MYKNEKVLNYSLIEGTIIHQEEGLEISVQKQELGMLYLPSGKIVANDPLVHYENNEFLISVASGSYPVSIYVARFDREEVDRRAALAKIEFSNKKPVKWEMALVSGDKVDTLGNEQFFGYGVDSGTGGFMDKTVADKLTENMKDGTFFDSFSHKFDTLLQETYVHTYSYGIGNVFGGENNELACFSSGFGDGSYPSYFGFDENGDPCVLVTDFCILQ